MHELKWLLWFGIIIDRPFIDAISPSISTVTGRDVSLYCHAMGEYSPSITWQFSNGTQIRDSSTTSISQVNVERSYLRLSNIFNDFFSSEIKCVATNQLGAMTRVINLAAVGTYVTVIYAQSIVELCSIYSKQLRLFLFRFLWRKCFDWSKQSWFTVAVSSHYS